MSEFLKDPPQDVEEVPEEGSNEEVPEVYLTPQKTVNLDDILPKAKVIKHTQITDDILKRMKEHPENFMVENNPFTAATTIIYGFDNLSNSRWKLIRDVARNISPNVAKGPFNVMGTDGKIIVHNGKHNQAPLFQYMWNGGNGELLSFDVSDDFTESTVEVSQQSSIDGNTKEVVTNTTQTVATEVQSKDGMVTWLDASYFQEKPKAINEVDQVAVNTKPFIGYDVPGKGYLVNDTRTDTGVNYSSKTEAINQIKNRYIATQEDVDAYWNQVQQQYQNFSTASNKGDVKAFMELLRKSNTLEDYVVKKKVTVVTQLDPIAFSGFYETKRYQQNKYNPGELASTDYESLWYKGYKEIIKKGYNVLPKRDNYPNASYNGYSARDLDSIKILEEVEVEVPIAGARILSSCFAPTQTQGVGNDVVKKTENEIKANAQVLGNPLLQCSQVILIDNVGIRYSGDWYSKKVTHDITNGDYTCSIEFKKKSILMSKVTYQQKTPTQSAYANINKVANETLQTGRYLDHARVKAYVEKVKESSLYKGKSLRVDIVSTSPLTIEIYDANVKFDISTPISKINLDEKGDPKK